MSADFPVVSAIQMVSSDDIAGNMRAAQSLISRAVQDHGATLVVLPENFLAMGPASQHSLSQQIPFYLETLQAHAKTLGVNLVAGSLPVPNRAVSNDPESRFRSASFLIRSTGAIVARYDKIHLFDVDVADGLGAYRESDTYEAGDAIKVANVGSCKVGLSICYDLRFPMLFQHLVASGAEIIALPAAFTKVTGQAHWEILLRARAIETQCFIIAANQGGRHGDKRETWGHSMIIDPWGRILSQCETGEGICSAQLDLDELHQIRAAMPIQTHQQKPENGAL